MRLLLSQMQIVKKDSLYYLLRIVYVIFYVLKDLSPLNFEGHKKIQMYMNFLYFLHCLLTTLRRHHHRSQSRPSGPSWGLASLK